MVRQSHKPSAHDLHPFGGAHARSGMTLMEILVVVLLISMVLSVIGVSAGGIFGARLVKVTSKMSAMARYTYNLASLRGEVYRMVIDMSAGEYYVERVKVKEECAGVVMDGDKERVKKEDEPPVMDPGELFRDMRVRKEKLPKGISIAAVHTRRNKTPVEEGKEVINFFPDGTAEKAFVWVTNGDETFTVEVTALRGTGIVHRDDLDAKELDKR